MNSPDPVNLEPDHPDPDNPDPDNLDPDKPDPDNPGPDNLDPDDRIVRGAPDLRSPHFSTITSSHWLLP